MGAVPGDRVGAVPPGWAVHVAGSRTATFKRRSSTGSAFATSRLWRSCAGPASAPSIDNDYDPPSSPLNPISRARASPSRWVRPTSPVNPQLGRYLRPQPAVPQHSTNLCPLTVAVSALLLCEIGDLPQRYLRKVSIGGVGCVRNSQDGGWWAISTEPRSPHRADVFVRSMYLQLPVVADFTQG